MLDLLLERDAVISECGMYRYQLSRRWADGPVATFIMLNPSTADALVDDATIRKCMGFARKWGMGGIMVGNLFAFRATKPADMRKALDPVGPENETHLERICHEAGASGNGGIVICAWGANGSFIGQDQTFLGWCERWLIKPKALRLTSKGMPEHPLYVPYDVNPVTL
jgi:hypothetical protein